MTANLEHEVGMARLFGRFSYFGVIKQDYEVIELIKEEQTQMAGVQGFEPRLTEPESVVLPLDDTPTATRIISIKNLILH